MSHSLILLLDAATMESLLLSLERDVLAEKMGAVTGVATSLAAACVAISMIGIGSKFLKGHQFDWWQFVRPLLIFFLVCNFQSLVLAPIRGIAGVYNTRLAAAVGSSTAEFKAVFREKAVEMCRREFGQDGDESTFDLKDVEPGALRFLKKAGNRVTRSFFAINEKMNLGAATVVSGIMFFLLNLFLSIMVIIANMYLVVMALIGPFTFAVAILTTYPGGIRLWVERYIQYTLWQPLLYTVMYIGTRILILGNGAVSWGGFWTWCFMCAAIFTMIRQVPAIASFVIESAGTEALANQMSGLGSDMLRKASSAAMLIK